MAIMTTTTVISAKDLIWGSDTVTMVAGKHLTIETSPAGAELYNGVVPVGKVWTAKVSVEIIETPA